MPRLRPIGLAPAATARRPSWTIAWASTVAVVVPSPATSLVLVATSLVELRTEVLERVVELDLTGDGHTVVGDGRRAPLLVEDDVAALGAERHLDGVGERVDAALERAAGVLVELQDLRHRLMLLFRNRAVRYEKSSRPRPAGGDLSQRATSLGDGSGNDGEHVAGGEDEVLLAGVLHLGAAVLAVDDLVADGDVERDAVAVVVDATRADRQDLALLGLLLGGVRDDQAGGRGLLGVEGLDDDAVLEGLDVDRHDVDLHFLHLSLRVGVPRRGLPDV